MRYFACEIMGIWLVRHVETDWSVAGKHTGRTDIPLSDAGREHASRIEIPQRDWALIASSPLGRARQTAELAGFPEPALRDDLLEWDYGDYEGITTADIRKDRPDWDLWTDGVPGGESPEQVAARADSFLAEAAATNGDVLVFSHGHAIRALGARWVRQPIWFGRHLGLDTAAISELGFERETPVIRAWNVTSADH